MDEGLVQVSELFQNFGLTALELICRVSWKPTVRAVALALLVEQKLFHYISKKKKVLQINCDWESIPPFSWKKSPTS